MSLALRRGFQFPSLRLWRFWRAGEILDQGQFPHCVGFAWRQWLSSAPLMTRGGPGPNNIYFEAQKLDEWEGEDYSGTSVRAGAKFLDQQGHIANYLWAQNPDELKKWILTMGTVVVGTNWYSGMDDLTEKGEAFSTGSILGGHAYVIVGYNRLTRRYRCINSWGEGWGQKGRFWIREDEMHKLIFNEYGEACAAVEKPV